MARTQWTYRGLPSSPLRYYGNPRPQGPGLEAFAVAQLNAWRWQVINDLNAVSAQAKTNVRARSRVDTGYMIRHVTGKEDFSSDNPSIEFGWLNDDPFYAKFQEFGTSRGIKPMMAVAESFDIAFNDLKKRWGGR